MKKFLQYLKDSVAELKRVSWPKKDELVRHTIVVLAFTFGFALLFGLADTGLKYLYNSYNEATAPYRAMNSSGTVTTEQTPILPEDIQISTGATMPVEVE